MNKKKCIEWKLEWNRKAVKLLVFSRLKNCPYKFEVKKISFNQQTIKKLLPTRRRIYELNRKPGKQKFSIQKKKLKIKLC